MRRTVEYELARLIRDEEDKPIDRSILLPEDGKPFPRLQLGDDSVREEVMRLHHKLVADIPCRDVEVTVRPFGPR